MAFSQTDLDNIDGALVQLALGKRVRSITIAGETTEFESGATPAELLAVRTHVENQIALDSGSSSDRTYAFNGGRG